MVPGIPENTGMERYALRLSLYVVMGMSVVASLGNKISPSGTDSGASWIVFAVCLAGLAASARDVSELEE